MTIRLFSLLLALLIAPMSFAVTVENLYRAEVILPLIKSEKDVIDKAYGLAVEEVLIKVSGNEEAVQDVLSLAKKNAPKWVAQHSINDEQDLLELDDGIFSAKKVEVNFYPQLINDFLFEQGLPVWGDNRPSVLLWLIEQRGFERKAAGVEASSALLNEIAQSATAKGLPIYAPLQDAQDKAALSPSTLWGLFDDPILQASARYQTDVVSVFKVTEVEEGYEGTLLLLLPEEDPMRIYLEAEDQEAMAAKVNQSIASVFSKRYAAVKGSEESSSVLMQVANIANHENLDKVRSYLLGLGIVSDLYLTQIKGDAVVFTLALNGGVEKMVNAINLDQVIAKVDVPFSDLESPEIQTYRYNGAR